MTLTFRRSWNLESLVERAFDCFRKLRRRKILEGVRGGFYSVEVKPPNEQGWYVHIHVILDGFYMLQGVLSDEWKDITGDSFYVDIRSVRNRKAGVFYLLGYVFICKELKDRETMPEWMEFPIKTRSDFRELSKERLDPSNPERYPDNWEELVKEYKNRDYPLGIFCGSLYGWPRNWMGVERL
ncbi:hypothetical protein AKJ64_04720, partial [candidate division MSBL1 archaeon SCGC-AAA259E17]